MGRQHALIFAGLAGKVEGFDIAPGMIEYANKNAQQAGMENARFHVLDWDTADLKLLGWQKRFQLVFASRTPAVYDRVTLEKMTEASRGYCCLITQVTGDNSVRRELAPVVGATNDDDYTRRGLYCAFNILWLQGYYPEVEYLERTWDSECPLEEAIVMYTRHFNSRGQLTEVQEIALADKLCAMTTIMPQGELVRKAAAYLAEQRALHTGKSLSALLDEAGMRFNLTPLDAAALERLFREEEAKAH